MEYTPSSLSAEDAVTSCGGTQRNFQDETRYHNSERGPATVG